MRGKTEEMESLLLVQQQPKMESSIPAYPLKAAEAAFLSDELEQHTCSSEGNTEDRNLLPVDYTTITANRRDISLRWRICRAIRLRAVCITLVKILGFAIIGGFFFLVWTHLAMIQEFINHYIMKIRYVGIFSPIIFTISHGILSSIFIPAELLTISGGFLFTSIYGNVAGLFLGFFCGIGGLYICSFLCLFVSRYLLFPTAHAYLIRFQFFPLLSAAISEKGTQLVVLMRLCPLFPFALTSYFLGLTPLKAGPYAIGTVGCVPGVFLLALAGSKLESWGQVADGWDYVYISQGARNVKVRSSSRNWQ
ncbi:SnaRE associated protein [Cardiosporidium cionae]|uniref:SnaRE associated protein n=1 Tax=Cardiosporidium cionae TaxID=476202 RepID=A0ABQ7JD68_9APIC|nr:SnaRE associated protein [Cardiosporidium cionae]|eukprot:KAF8821962.1 SnaRE associated protein [Cardiosporidium cionae]